MNDLIVYSNVDEIRKELKNIAMSYYSVNRLAYKMGLSPQSLRYILNDTRNIDQLTNLAYFLGMDLKIKIIDRKVQTCH